MSDHSFASGQFATVTSHRINNYGVSQHNSKFNILDHLHKLDVVKETNIEYHCNCPVCGDGGFKVNKTTGKYSTFKCDCNTGVTSKQTFIKAITGETTSSTKNTRVTIVNRGLSSISKKESGTHHPTIKKVPMQAGKRIYRYEQWDDETLRRKGITNPFTCSNPIHYLEKLVKVHRENDGNGGKKIWMEPTGVDTSKALPYGIDELFWADKSTHILFITEGERTTDTLNNYFSERKIKAIATTNIGGVGKWRELHTNTIYQLSFQKVVLCPDGDKVGFDHMVDVYNQFESRGIKCNWLLSDNRPYNELPEKKGIDMSDIIDGNHLEDDFDLEDAIASPEDIAWLNKLLSLSVEDEDFTSEDKDDEWTVEKFDAWLQQAVGDENEDDWIIDGLISAGSNIIAAPSGTGKSILATQIAMAIIIGKEILGSEVKKQGKVLYHCSDEPTRRLGSRLIAQGILDTQDRDKFIPIIKVEDGNRWNYSHIKELERMLKNHKPVAFILDSLRSITKPLGIKEKDEQIGEVVTHLRDICEKYSVSLVIVHHNRKDSTSDLNSVVGSGSIVSPVDVVWSMAKNPSKGKFARKLTLVKNRQGEDEITKHLLLDDETLTFTVNHEVSDEDDEDSSSERKVSAKDKILDYLKSNAGNWVTLDDLVEATELSKNNIKTTISRLKNDSSIETNNGSYRLLS